MKFKALSFRQPWAQLVIMGEKSLDLRTWRTYYRGPLAVYASRTVEKEACVLHGFDPKKMTTGAVIGIVELVDIQMLDEGAYQAKIDQHLSGRRYREGLYGWKLANPWELERPQPVRGRLNLFEVEILLDEFNADVTETFTPIDERISDIPPRGDAKPFELRVLAENKVSAANGTYRLALYQRAVEPPSAQRSLYKEIPGQMERVAELGRDALKAVADQVLEALRENGYKATDLGSARRQPFQLDEEWGVRLGLLFLAVGPIRKMTRVEAISEGVRDMTSEELYYWYSKCTEKARGRRARKALRVLLAEE